MSGCGVELRLFFADVTLSVSPPGKLKNCLSAVESEPSVEALRITSAK